MTTAVKLHHTMVQIVQLRRVNCGLINDGKEPYIYLSQLNRRWLPCHTIVIHISGLNL